MKKRKMKKNHKITVFTWPWNTGKSTLIENLNKEWNYKVYKEIARQHFDKAGNMKEFQRIILQEERKRLFELFSYTGSKDVLIDRTFADNLIYIYWNIINWKLENEFDFGELAGDITDSIDIYDEVILFTEPFKNSNITAVAGMEARGFIFGSLVAWELNVGFIPLRKPGKLPYDVQSVAYTLEYGEASLEAHIDAIKPNDRILLIDDLLATGGTAKASCQLVEKLGGEVVACAFVIELAMLHGRGQLKNTPIHSLIQY